MQVMLDRDQSTVLREILESALNQLRIESARADSHDFRAMLHARERTVEGLLAQLGAAPPATGVRRAQG